MVQALRTHRVNTLAELRRIERCLAATATTEVSEAMTKACEHQFVIPTDLSTDIEQGHIMSIRICS